MITKGKFISNFLLNDYLGFLNKRKIKIANGPLDAAVVGWFADRVIEGTIDKNSVRKRLIQIAEENFVKNQKKYLQIN